jgi:predicted nuclease of predicted toxin-antitoxin system
MPIAFYIDEQVSKKLIKGLRAFEVDVLTVQEDGFASMSDADILDRANYLGRVVVTFDRHFLVEARRRLDNNISFYGVIRIRSKNFSAGKIIDDLRLIAEVEEPKSFINQEPLYLPL